MQYHYSSKETYFSFPPRSKAQIRSIELANHKTLRTTYQPQYSSLASKLQQWFITKHLKANVPAEFRDIHTSTKCEKLYFGVKGSEQRKKRTVGESEFIFCLQLIVAKSCLTLMTHGLYSPPGSSVHGLLSAKKTGVDCHFLLHGIFPTQGSNLCLLNW